VGRPRKPDGDDPRLQERAAYSVPPAEHLKRRRDLSLQTLAARIAREQEALRMYEEARALTAWPQPAGEGEEDGA
jgi:hypothetical protein